MTRRVESADFLLRPVRDADIAAITAIYADAVRNGTASFETEPPSEDVMIARCRTLQAGGYPYFVSERAGNVAGYAYAGPYRPRAAYRWTVEDSVYVASAARGSGIGKALLGRLIAECELRGFRLMVAVIGDANSKASIDLHRTLGFHEAGRLEGIGWKHGRWLSTVLMQRALGPGSARPPEGAGDRH